MKATKKLKKVRNRPRKITAVTAKHRTTTTTKRRPKLPNRTVAVATCLQMGSGTLTSRTEAADPADQKERKKEKPVAVPVEAVAQHPAETPSSSSPASINLHVPRKDLEGLKSRLVDPRTPSDDTIENVVRTPQPLFVRCGVSCHDVGRWLPVRGSNRLVLMGRWYLR